MNSKLYSSFILLLLFTSIVSAALIDEPPSGVPIDDDTFEDTSDGVLSTQIGGGFGGFTNGLFRNSEDLTFSKVIVFYALLVMVFFTLIGIIPLVPFLQGIKSYFISAIFTVLIAFSGAYALVTDLLFSISLKISSSWANVILLGVLIVLSILLTIFSSVMKKIYNAQQPLQAEMTGMKLATDIAIAKREAEINKDSTSS